MAVTQYIGARYVPLFAEPAEWDSIREYEPLTIVLYQGASYTSRQAVPAGIDITNTDFWILTGNYNAQVEAYRREVQGFSGDIEAATEGVAANAQAISEETDARIAGDNALDDEIASLSTTVSEHTSSISTLGADISSEATARAEADAAIRNELSDGLADEAQARSDADDAIDERITSTIDYFEGKLSKIIRSFFIFPEYMGCFTAFNGLWMSSANFDSKPYSNLQQGYCIGKNGEHKFLLRNAASTSCRVATANTLSNSYSIPSTEYNFGHGNQLEYDPVNDRYFINTGSGFVVTDANFNTIGAFNIPDGNGYGCAVRDAKTGDWFVVSYNGNIYDFDPQTYSLEDTGIVVDRDVLTGENVQTQGGALYDGILVFPYGKSRKEQVAGLYTVDIATGKVIAKFDFPQFSDVLPIGEPEDVSFDSNGNLYMATGMRVNTNNDYCATTALYRMNFFDGNFTGAGKTYSELGYNIHLECSNYHGFYSDGSADYPFKSLHEASLYLSTPGSVRVLKCGLESPHSTTTAQEWFGFLEVAGRTFTVQVPGAGNITIMGRYIFRSCNVSLRNRQNFKQWYSSATGQNFVSMDDGIINSHGIKPTENSDSRAVGLGGIVNCSGAGSAHFNYIDTISSVPKFQNQYNAGEGCYLGNPHTES